VILLAGYLRLVPPAVVQAYPRRILNIHPALLPAFGGKGMWGHHVHEAVLASGASFSGATIHFVDEEYDTGSILAQWPVPVLKEDTPATLAARVLKVEHLLYPRAMDHLCRAVDEGRPVRRLSPPGEAFQITATFSAEAIAGQIERAFSARPYPVEERP
jgi:folate-dependent phosphoribosylglycinamide formyltransferase PurN